MRPVLVAWIVRVLGPSYAWCVPGYAIMLVVGGLLGAVLVVDATSRAGYARRDTLTVLALAWIGGLLGAACVPAIQGLAVLAETGRYRTPTGLAAYGGLIGGMLTTIVALRRRGLAALPFLDAGVPALGVGYFFARIGCFLAGCDYGKPTTLPFAVRFPPGSHAFRDHVARGWIGEGAAASLPVHPTQLYLAFAGLALYFATEGIPMGRGRRVVAYVVGYAVLRFFIETLRGDASRGGIGPLSTSQAIAIATVLVTAAVIRRKPVIGSVA